jgi:hypothetical protein
MTDNVNLLEEIGRAALEWRNTTHGPALEHDHHCERSRGRVHPAQADGSRPRPEVECTCGLAAFEEALAKADE